MTEDERLALGTFCEGLLRDPHFGVVCSVFNNVCTEHLFTSALPERDTREFIYAKMAGVKEFLGLMKNAVIDRDGIMLERNANATGELKDEPVDPFDDE